ncbi:hypothetical protein [Brevibacillus laterosporus]|uniref:hypothetical protein n=1 Tax=Brevibacillus laterosporus TaxID=1465 RepID=UPI0018CED13C|nr:hypothetical protein [Brevibacillus laterosporus]MBG9789121.1 hypothetical protein [Brevibacillus laterosporus]
MNITNSFRTNPYNMKTTELSTFPKIEGSSIVNEGKIGIQQDSVEISSDAMKAYSLASGYDPEGPWQKMNVAGFRITYQIDKRRDEGIIRVKVDSNLQKLIRDDIDNVYDLAKKLRKTYKAEMGETFGAGTGSVAAEIVCHAVPDKVAKLGEKIASIIPRVGNDIIRALKSFRSHTDIADIGEDDRERFLMDYLGKNWDNINYIFG